MNKEVNMTIRIEPDLRTRFTQAAELEHRPAAQVIRDFMRTYVEKSEERSRISPEERRRRQEAVQFGRANVELEGFKIPDEERVHAQRFVSGEIGIDEYIKGH